MRKTMVIPAIIMVVTTLAACKKIFTTSPAEDQILDGPVDELTPEQKDRFLAGDAAFNKDVFTAQNGLGPISSLLPAAPVTPAMARGIPLQRLPASNRRTAPVIFSSTNGGIATNSVGMQTLLNSAHAVKIMAGLHASLQAQCSITGSIDYLR